MNTNKIAKIIVSFMLMFGVATSSFAMSSHNDRHQGKVKIEQKHKKGVDHNKIIIVKKDNHHKKYHKKYVTKEVNYYNNCDVNNVATAVVGLGIGLLIANAING